MFFHSPTALIIFLPFVFLFYPLVEKSSKRLSLIFLLLFSLSFYGFDHPWFLIPLMISSLSDYFISRNLITANLTKNKRLLFLSSSIFINIGLLAIFKYLPFIEETISFINHKDISILPWEFNIILPAGISFYTFQTLSYVFDCYKNKLKTLPNLLDYLLYVCYFPQLVAGPILRPSDFFNKDSLCKINSSNSLLISGFRRICFGLFLKLCLADEIAKLNDIAFNSEISTSALSSLDAWTMAFGFGLQIYFDFSAYSHMAIGISEIIGLPIRENFAFPYLSKSATEFWRRWHISLSNWVNDYLYSFLNIRLPLFINGILPLLLTWSIMGFWHGSSWRFIAWGGINGILVLIHRIVKTNLVNFLPIKFIFNSFFSWIITIFSIMSTWIYFRSQNFEQANYIFKSLFNFNLTLNFRENYYLVVFLFWCLTTFSGLLWMNKEIQLNLFLKKNKLISLLACTFCLTFSLLFLGSQNTFIYFQF